MIGWIVAAFLGGILVGLGVASTSDAEQVSPMVISSFPAQGTCDWCPHRIISQRKREDNE